MSCPTANKAPRDIFHSKRRVKYKAMITKKTIRALRAFPATSSPKEGLTVRALTSSAFTCPFSARTAATDSALAAFGNSPRTRNMSSPPVIFWTRASSMPASAAAPSISAVDTCSTAGISHTPPPSNSMPRFSEIAASLKTSPVRFLTARLRMDSCKKSAKLWIG